MARRRVGAAPVPALPAGALHGRLQVTGRSEATTQPSPSYLYTLSAACVGLPCIGVGLGGALIARAGGDPISAFDFDGTAMFLLMFAIVFAVRLLFWPPVPSILRACVRLAVTAILVIEVPLAVLGLVLALTLPPTMSTIFVPIYFSCFAVLFQIGTVWWLMRYRQEGL